MEKEKTMLFRSKVRPGHARPEMNDGKTLTEMQGYIPSNVQVENMIQAGMRLSQYRKEQYDGSVDDEGSLIMDPTRSPNFDMADASAIKEQVSDRLKKQAEAARKRAQEQAEAEKVKKDVKSEKAPE